MRLPPQKVIRLPQDYSLITFEKSSYVIESKGEIQIFLGRLPKLPLSGGHLKN